MPISAARLLANRQNAAKSTGPRTEAGKAISRQNSYKHGLTGDGVVMPVEQVAEVTRRFESLKAELKPSGEAGRIFLRRFAYLSVRLEKSEEFDQAATATRVRHAVEAFDDQRMTDLEGLIVHFATDPMTVARRLQNMPEGVDWLVKQCLELRDDLMIADRPAWTLNHRSRLEQILGLPGGNVRMTRTYALSQALGGYFAYLEPSDGAGLDDPARVEWARLELAAIIDAEIDRLQALKIALDPTTLERDRLEAPSRALFDASPAMNLARKYEAATERAMYKALNQFHEVELVALESEPVVASTIPDDTSEVEMASFFPRSDAGLDPVVEPSGSLPQSAYLREVGESERFQARKSKGRRVPILARE